MKRDRLEIFYLFLFVSLLVELLAWGLACAQDLVDCVPLTDASVVLVAEDLALDLEQTVWLRREIAARRLHRPRHLDGLPGAGAELRETLVAAFCWGPSVKGRVQASVRTRPGGWRRETRLEATGDRVQASLRRRQDPEAPAVLRGGLSAGSDRLQVSAGSLRARRGLGLILATPGAQVRGTAPSVVSRAGWRLTHSLDLAVVRGVAVRTRHETWELEGAWFEDRFTPGGRYAGNGATLEIQRRAGGRQWGATLLRLRGETMLSGHLRGGGEVGSWSLEWAGGSRAGARAVSWAWKEGVWRLRGSLEHVDGGFRAPAGAGPTHPQVDAAVGLRYEGRWQGAEGRFLRAGGYRHQAPERAGAGWPESSQRLELEVGDRPAPGWRVGWLWRETAQALTGRSEEEVVTRVVRLDVVRDRAGVRWSLRFEKRAEGPARSWGVASRIGGGAGVGSWDWELRSAQVFRPLGSPAIPGYRRRAGGVHGWDDLAHGTWLGGWVRTPALRLRGSRGRLEMSVDGMPDRWDVVLAVEVIPGGE